MRVAAVCLYTMYDAHPQSTNSDSMDNHRSRRTQSVVSYTLVAVAVVAFVVVPVLMIGVALGVGGVRLRRRLAGLLHRQDHGTRAGLPT
jgi:hypothetical protein